MMMGKARYLVELEKYLVSLNSEERDDVLEYYSELIADAGLTDEAEISARFGEPQVLAEKIMTDYDVNNPSKTSTRSEITTKIGKHRLLKWTLIILAIIVCSPAIVGIIGGGVGLFFGVTIAILGILLAMIITVVVAFYIGVSLLFSQTAVGTFYLGLAFLCLGFFILVSYGLKWLVSLLSRGWRRFRRKRYLRQQAQKVKGGK